MGKNEGLWFLECRIASWLKMPKHRPWAVSEAVCTSVSLGCWCDVFSSVLVELWKQVYIWVGYLLCKIKLKLKEGRRISWCVEWEYLQWLFQQCATLELRIAFYFEVILPTTEHSSVVTQCTANLTQNGCQLPLGTIGPKPQAAIRWLFFRRVFFFPSEFECFFPCDNIEGLNIHWILVIDDFWKQCSYSLIYLKWRIQCTRYFLLWKRTPH